MKENNTYFNNPPLLKQSRWILKIRALSFVRIQACVVMLATHVRIKEEKDSLCCRAFQGIDKKDIWGQSYICHCVGSIFSIYSCTLILEWNQCGLTAVNLGCLHLSDEHWWGFREASVTWMVGAFWFRMQCVSGGISVKLWTHIHDPQMMSLYDFVDQSTWTTSRLRLSNKRSIIHFVDKFMITRWCDLKAFSSLWIAMELVPNIHVLLRINYYSLYLPNTSFYDKTNHYLPQLHFVCSACYYSKCKYYHLADLVNITCYRECEVDASPYWISILYVCHVVRITLPFLSNLPACDLATGTFLRHLLFLNSCKVSALSPKTRSFTVPQGLSWAAKPYGLTEIYGCRVSCYLYPLSV